MTSHHLLATPTLQHSRLFPYSHLHPSFPYRSSPFLFVSLVLPLPFLARSVASDIESKQPVLPDLNKLRKDLEADGFKPVFVVLVQELERWEILNNCMSKSLKQVKKALMGEIAMSNDLDALGVSLFNGMLPGMWRKLTPQTDKMLGSWMTFHLRRHVQYRQWIEEGEPKVMRLSHRTFAC